MGAFRRLVGFEHGYEISLTGEVRSVQGLTADGRFRAARVVVPSIDASGSRAVKLRRRDGTWVHRQLARLVLETFYGPAPTPNHVAKHKDGARANNTPENLEWAPAKRTRFWTTSDAVHARKQAEARRTVMYVTKRTERYDPPGW